MNRSFEEYTEDIIQARQSVSYYFPAVVNHDEIVAVEAIAQHLKDYREKIAHGGLKVEPVMTRYQTLRALGGI